MGDVVTVHEVSKHYRLGKLSVTALAGVSLRVAAGEFLAVAGPSGSGKTTLLNLIGFLDTPTAGEIAIDGEPVTRLSPGRRADLRARKLGFVFQTFNLIPVLTAGLKDARHTELPVSRDRVRALKERLGRA